MPDHHAQCHEVAVSVLFGGTVDFHVHVHFDHAALAAKLGQATDKLNDAVAAELAASVEPKPQT